MKINYKLFELSAAAITGILKLLMMNWLDWKLAYIVLTLVFWLGYIAYRVRSDREVLARWGFSKKGMKESFLCLTPLLLIAVLACIAIGYYNKVQLLNWHILPTLLLYPIWGVLQQFLIVGLVAGNLQDLKQPQLGAGIIILITAILFGIVHFPHLWLIGGTFALALVYTSVYLRWRNLWPLGLYHGWLGCIFYFYVLQRDPWAEVFSKMTGI